MLIAHLSDIHYCDKYLDEVDRCMESAVTHIRATKPGLIVLSGDTFDHRLEQNSPALLAAVARVTQLGEIAPVLILQGTLSHDVPHAVDIFRNARGSTTWPVYVADRIEQVVLGYGEFRPLADFDQGLPEDGVLLSCLPAVNKGQVAAAVGAENAAEAVGEHVAALLRGWAPSHDAARAEGVPTVIVTHGTVSGALTEHGVPMAGLDHEYTTGALFASHATAVMVGHIHKHQAWARDDRLIAYPGSLGRLHHGEYDPKGWLLWDVQAHTATLEFIATPARELVGIDFPGAPDMTELARIAAATPAHAHVRVRYSIDEEHRASVDRDAIAALFAGCADVRIEGAIVPVQRQRAAGIGQAVSLEERMRRWCETTNTAAEPLVERLRALQAGATTTPEVSTEAAA